MTSSESPLAMLASEGVPRTEIGGQLFVRDRRRILPFGPLLANYEVSREHADELLATLGGSWVQWTRMLDAGAASKGWYAVICRRFTPVEGFTSANTRSKLRRGLKRCRVRMVSLDEFIEHAYEIHAAAVRGYGSSSASLANKEAHCAALERERGFDRFRNYWLVWLDEHPIASAKTILHGTAEVDYTAIKFDPEHLKHYPSYALLHEMNKHYLGELQFAAVSDGQRSVHHDTHFQEFLVKDLLFERAPLQLRIRYDRKFRIGMKFARLARGPLGRVSSNVRALLELDRCADEL